MYEKLNENGVDITSLSLPESLWKPLWSLNVSERIKLFLWKCLQDALPTNAKLYGKVKDISPLCTMCNNDIETTEHLLFYCPYATYIWNSAPNPVSLNLDQYNTILDLCKTWLENPRKDIHLETLLTKMWFIWKERCDRIFEAKSKDSSVLNLEILRYVEFWSTKKGKSLRHTRKKITSFKWKVPSMGRLKFNVDATWISESLSSTYGFIMRNESGDCEGGKNAYVSWRSKAYMQEAHRLANLCNNFLGFVFVPRAGNKVADSIAKFSKNITNCFEWEKIPPICSKKQLLVDKSNIGSLINPILDGSTSSVTMTLSES
ncbi:uncharacterized protein LOC113312843 [Papaver somniferum]|uniref:uncharacterized protein LOC113312843 n=1 Tax=Papaver somniferum TaxID=3469 RepID=UPI000E6FC41B|nr:uncharacterized protein LOC113312843 [Papaver somniferum]